MASTTHDMCFPKLINIHSTFCSSLDEETFFISQESISPLASRPSQHKTLENTDRGEITDPSWGWTLLWGPQFASAKSLQTSRLKHNPTSFQILWTKQLQQSIETSSRKHLWTVVLHIYYGIIVIKYVSQLNPGFQLELSENALGDSTWKISFKLSQPAN